MSRDLSDDLHIQARDADPRVFELDEMEDADHLFSVPFRLVAAVCPEKVERAQGSAGCDFDGPMVRARGLACAELTAFGGFVSERTIQAFGMNISSFIYQKIVVMPSADTTRYYAATDGQKHCYVHGLPMCHWQFYHQYKPVDGDKTTCGSGELKWATWANDVKYDGCK